MYGFDFNIVENTPSRIVCEVNDDVVTIEYEGREIDSILVDGEVLSEHYQPEEEMYIINTILSLI
jgi:hypothetical protein